MLGVDVRDPKPRLGVLVREQAEAGDDRRPPPRLRPELEQLDRERVTGLGALDENRPADRIDVREVELRDVVDTGCAGDLLVGGVADVQQNRLARLDLERRLDRVVPRVLVGVGTEVVERVGLHLEVRRGGPYAKIVLADEGRIVLSSVLLTSRRA